MYLKQIGPKNRLVMQKQYNYASLGQNLWIPLGFYFVYDIGRNWELLQ